MFAAVAILSLVAGAAVIPGPGLARASGRPADPAAGSGRAGPSVPPRAAPAAASGRAAGSPAAAASASASERAREIVDHVDRMLRGRSSVAKVRMTIRTAHWQRSLEIRVWSKGTERALILILAPTKERGTATLKVGDNIWNYLPKVERVIKIPTSMMMGSWMGSHFTNDDLVKESRLVRDYDISLAFEGERGGEDVWEFALEPRPEAAVVWGAIRLEVRKRDLMPIRQRYFDEDGKLVRTLAFSDYRQMGGRLVPARMEMRPADAPEEHTTITYEELEFDVSLDDDFFSLRRLRNLRAGDLG